MLDFPLGLASAFSLDVDNFVLGKKSVSHCIKCNSTSAIEKSNLLFLLKSKVTFILTFLRKFVHVYN